jgi:histidinol dehydrogenase
MPAINRLSTRDPDFRQRLDALLAWEGVSDEAVFATVREILDAVRRDGDDAVLEYTRRFDRLDVSQAAELEIPLFRLEQARTAIPAEQLEALETAAARIRRYAERQKMDSWQYTEADGTVLGQQVTPLDRVGLYVPGGKAAYPSSVLMNAIPAKVAGVESLIMVVPTPGGEVNELVLAAAAVAGVDRVFAVGGAQAVAALAYGTRPSRPWTRSWVRATSTWPRPSAWSSVRWVST